MSLSGCLGIGIHLFWYWVNSVLSSFYKHLVKAEQSDVVMEEQSDSSTLIPQIGRDASIKCLLLCSISDHQSIASVNRSFRSLIRSGELHRERQRWGIVGHWVCFACDPYEWTFFNPVDLGWKRLPRLPRGFITYPKGALAVGTELLLLGRWSNLGVNSRGGWGTRHAIYNYSLLTNSWSLGREMNEPRRSFGSASLGKFAIVAGGEDPVDHILSSAEIYNSGTGMGPGTWETLPRMNRPRKMCSAVFMDGKFYVVGGIGVDNPNGLTCGEMYDLDTRTWRVIPNMFPERIIENEAPPLLAVVKNELYAAFYSENEVRRYDKGRNRWSAVGNLPEGAVSMNGWGLVFRAYGDHLIVIFGEPSLEGIDIYDCVPDEGILQWRSLTFNYDLSCFVHNSTVMGC